MVFSLILCGRDYRVAEIYTLTLIHYNYTASYCNVHVAFFRAYVLVAYRYKVSSVEHSSCSKLIYMSMSYVGKPQTQNERATSNTEFSVLNNDVRFLDDYSVQS